MSCNGISANQPDTSIQWKSHLPRESHVSFFEERNWPWVEDFWKRAIAAADLPRVIVGEEPYTVIDLQPIHEVGAEEFASDDPRYRRKTFAVRVGYLGSAYHGFQRQHSEGSTASVATVEDDIQKALGCNIVAAGRTDRDVSAVSQVISFSTYDSIGPQQVLERIRRSAPGTEGRLAAWHGSFPPAAVDVDATFVQQCLLHLEGRSLPYNGFAHRDSRQSDDGLGDICVLRRCRASVMDLAGEDVLSLANAGSTPRLALCIELVGSRFLRRMVRLLVATAVRESCLGETRDEEVLLKIALSGDRSHASLAAPGAGLALAGVGYDLAELRRHKHPPSSLPRTAGPAAAETDNAAAPDPCGDSSPPRPAKRARAATPAPPLASREEVHDAVHRALAACEAQLAARDALVLHYPQRCFAFPCSGAEVVLDNSLAEVSRTVWDAEVILAHVVDQLLGRAAPPATIAELGAGTALAALAAARHGRPGDVVCVQERDAHTLAHTLDGLGRNLGGAEVRGVAGEWGREVVRGVRIACRRGTVDLLLAADVLYHPEHFDDLRLCVQQLAGPHTWVVLVYEQRRRDLSGFVRELARSFAEHHEVRHAVRAEDGQRETVFAVHIFGLKQEGKKS